MAVETDPVSKRPCVLLTGASSQIGVFAIPRLVNAGFHILAVSRKGKPANYPDFETVEWLNEADAHQASSGCQYLLSAGPLELARKFIASAPQIHTAVIFSSSSVETKKKSDDLLERHQIEGMLALESELQQLTESRGLKLLILRPTLIYGCGLDTNISRLAGWIRRYGFMPVNGRAAGLRQPVHADDLASAAITALQSKRALPPVLHLTGGSTLSYSDMVCKIFTALEQPVRLIRLPQWLFVLLVNVTNKLKITDGINSEMVRRQGLDLLFEDQQARELLDYSPRSFNPDEQDFSLPEQG